MVYTNECGMGNKEKELEANRANVLCTGIREKANQADVVGVCHGLPNQDGGAYEIFYEQSQLFTLVVMQNFH